MTSDEGSLHSFVESFYNEFMSLPVTEVAFPRGCNGMTEYADASAIYKKSTPIAVKGSLVYNHWLKKKGLAKKYPQIRDGEKIKFVYLKEPNMIHERVISFVAGIPEEFGLEKFIDHETQFNKTFIEPLITILNSVGWKVKEESSLEGLFS